MPQLPKAEKLGYSVAEACAALSIGKTTLYSHIAVRRLEAVRLGGRTIIPAASLKALLVVPRAKAEITRGCPKQDADESTIVNAASADPLLHQSGQEG